MIRFVSGDVRLTVLDGGRIRLDGGAMFGVVPKALWSRLRPSDERNRIDLAMNLLLVEDGHRRVLVDTGAGAGWDDKSRDIFGLEAKSPESILAPAGLEPAQIDLVVNSHLHFDHAGGNTTADAAGRVVAAFPNATYAVQAGELDFARLDNERTRASYRPSDVEPLVNDGRLVLLHGDAALDGPLRVRLAPGHTPGMQIVLVETGERTIAFLADLVPTSSHLPLPYVMGYDVEPLKTLESKRRIIPEALRERWLVVFEHDPITPLAALEERNGRVTAVAPELVGA
jgi:glyoxylase-like metal-dependent hydrolase (beta-lactamase superfamily II)